MRLTSPAFDNGGGMPTWCGKKADNISPPLEWSDVPDGTGSFALALVDVHPVARGYVHWMISGIPPETRMFRKGQATDLPPGTREHQPYAGPFPPSGTHSYEFRLFALEAPGLDLPAKVALDTFTRSVETNAIAKTVLTGTFTKL